MAVVVVKMNFCKKTHRITVKDKGDGTYSLHVATDCPEVREYVKTIGDTLDFDDLTSFETSKIFRHEFCDKITMTCLAPNGIINAAWMEAGMLSRSRAKEIGKNEVIFEADRCDVSFFPHGAHGSASARSMEGRSLHFRTIRSMGRASMRSHRTLL